MTEEHPTDQLKEAGKIVENAHENAANIVKAAQETADILFQKVQSQTSQMIVDSMKQAWGEGEDEKKIIMLNRVPYICEDIREIKGDMKKVMFAVLGSLCSAIIAIAVGVTIYVITRH